MGKELLRSNGKSENQKVLEAEYSLYNEKYALDQIANEQHLCIFIEGYDIMGRSNYERMLKSIESQNYSNYHIVVVDDSSPSQQSAN